MLSKDVSSTIFKVFGMMRPGIEPRSPGSLANTLPARPMSCYQYTMSLNTMIFSPHLLFLCFKPSILFVYYTYMLNQKFIFVIMQKSSLHTIKNLIRPNPQPFLNFCDLLLHIFMRQPQICHTGHVSSHTHIHTHML